ncbi:cytochrome c oxidase subunit II [Afifella sp. IM 167]|uniref:cytochrome c oxidase subunit II n=1 Tax=Afifella sp. IM 167 TaxID=2033586 RepID=UPI001CD01829|nr:cytochrome c oxidase subunit II [Afifella sp. IM 167]
MAMGTVTLAQPAENGPFPWQIHMQTAATGVAEYVDWFAWYTLIIMIAICVFVFGLIAWAVFRFGHRRNPVPARFSHNTLVEVLWTVLPVFVLVAIAVPSFRLLYGEFDPSKIYADYNPQTDKFLTVKVTGHQWYWSYEYGVDEDSKSNGITGDIGFDAFMVPDDELGENGVRNLSVDNAMVVPVDTYVRLQVTGADVIHSFAMPSFAVKIDAVPGRLNETYFKADREGVYYGQCSELCGKDHAFMPAAIQVVSKEQFGTWAGEATADLGKANATLASMIEEAGAKAAANAETDTDSEAAQLASR